MSAPTHPAIGSITWFDLTVEHAERVRDFYREVVGWTSTDVDMSGYHDYCMNEPEDAKTVAGICHARGANAGLPPQWVPYITVEDIDQSIARCVDLGGSLVMPVRTYGGDARYAVLRDPAGAVFAVFESDDSAA